MYKYMYEYMYMYCAQLLRMLPCPDLEGHYHRCQILSHSYRNWLVIKLNGKKQE